jgi:hypothetical protein
MINQEPEPYFYLPTIFYIPWYWKGKGINGHGEMCVKISNRGEDIQIWNENLTKEETKEILHKYVELLVDKATMQYAPF